MKTARTTSCNSFTFNQVKGMPFRAYFVTLCTENRECYFGNVIDGEMISYFLSDMIGSVWLEVGEKFKNVELDVFCIMPNHFHGILLISQACKDFSSQPFQKDQIKKVIQFFKAKSTKSIHTCGCLHFKWERSHQERVIPNKKEFFSIRDYILQNPLRWAFDRENRVSKNFNMDLNEYFSSIFLSGEAEEGISSNIDQP